MTGFNYKDEVKKLQQKEERNWFKPQAGQYEIIILDEPERIEREFDEKQADGTIIQKKVEQARFNIESNKQQFCWDIGVGQTSSSLFGQIMLIADNFGTLTGKKITLVVKRSKNKNDYTVLEAVPLMNIKEEKVE